jgi:hypothetical protein
VTALSFSARVAEERVVDRLAGASLIRVAGIRAERNVDMNKGETKGVLGTFFHNQKIFPFIEY